MISLKNSEGLKFTTSATYRIHVKGFLDESWSDRLSGMLIENQASESKSPVAVLQGTMLDQTQLLGVLSNLYEMHLSLISVEFIADE